VTAISLQVPSRLEIVATSNYNSCVVNMYMMSMHVHTGAEVPEVPKMNKAFYDLARDILKLS